MDLYNSEFLRLISAFNKYKVQYIIVGGFASNFHGYKRTTGDVDFWMKDSLLNRENLIEALFSMGYGRLDSLRTAALLPGYCEIILDQGMYADLMGHITGFEQLDFDSCFVKAEVESVQGVDLRFLHYEQHIYSKRQSSRLKDQLDAQELDRINSEE